MTIRHFKIFICVCDEKTMTKAAEKMHMTQPSVSQAIHELEEYYQLQLFERLGRKLFLTVAGEKLLSYSRHIISLHEQTEKEMRQFGSVYRVRVGASVTIGESILVNLMQKISTIYPKNQITSMIHNTSRLEEMLLHDALDIALVEGTIHAEYLLAKPFMDDELVFIAAPSYPLIKHKKIKIEDLKEADFFVREEGSGTRELFENVMKEWNIKFRIAGVYNNAETIKKAVSAGLGISVISKLAVKNEIASGALISFNIEHLTFKRKFSIVYHKNKYLSKELKHIISLCGEWQETV